MPTNTHIMTMKQLTIWVGTDPGASAGSERLLARFPQKSAVNTAGSKRQSAGIGSYPPNDKPKSHIDSATAAMELASVMTATMTVRFSRVTGRGRFARLRIWDT